MGSQDFEKLINLYHGIFLYCGIAALIFLVAAIALFFVLKIPRVFLELTGRVARKAIEEMKEEGAETGNLTAQIGKMGDDGRRHRRGRTGTLGTSRLRKKTGNLSGGLPTAQMQGQAPAAPIQQSAVPQPAAQNAAPTMQGAMSAQPVYDGSEQTNQLMNDGSSETNVLGYGGAGSSETSVLSQESGSSETSVLSYNSGSSETSVLSYNSGSSETSVLNRADDGAYETSILNGQNMADAPTGLLNSPYTEPLGNIDATSQETVLLQNYRPAYGDPNFCILRSIIEIHTDEVIAE